MCGIRLSLKRRLYPGFWFCIDGGRGSSGATCSYQFAISLSATASSLPTAQRLNAPVPVKLPASDNRSVSGVTNCRIFPGKLRQSALRRRWPRRNYCPLNASCQTHRKGGRKINRLAAYGVHGHCRDDFKVKTPRETLSAVGKICGVTAGLLARIGTHRVATADGLTGYPKSFCGGAQYKAG